VSVAVSAVPEPFELEPFEVLLVALSGEMGIVLSGTGSVLLVAVAMRTDRGCLVVEKSLACMMKWRLES
jgi:hypothetical protein